MTHFHTADPLMSRILRRTRALFADDIDAHSPALRAAIDGKRLLVVGAAGSIGGAFVKQVVRFRPASLHLVDVNENTLVEIVRDLRSSSDLALPEDFKTVSVDFGTDEFLRFAADHGPYDAFVNFSAVKHVRSERDVYSLLRMVDVNVGALSRFLDHPSARGLSRIFSVSTDKSVRPVNLMGATKNLMEKVLFEQAGQAVASSARFANVAFSAGSLLEGFESRLAKGQPLAAPSDVRRYFISHEESGQLCLLAAFLGRANEVFFPRFDPDSDLMTFSDIAVAFLRHHGLEPILCASEDEARAMTAIPKGSWPCWFAPSDTTGEKPFEEFHRTGDRIDTSRFTALGVVVETPPPAGTVAAFLKDIAAIRDSAHWAKDEVVAAVRRAVPELVHEERHKSLEQKM
ncbi:Nucleoside-diphosphate sugar epimerases [Magnetospirillum sp. LM-5]|uniref:polysaccharide biosynthesis protein n=1 Tax=Magnetospirillum sp. LM-5 TaxID=2681466 RepID=UPI00138064A5|nr:polysaccharide biosynthesis protein [Magnetospirillum sp. LM-5]CAA7622616.1 Nucleoside-diphosphate sugar epimerases [Magnetospirillum sp. LM-5]